MHSDIFIMNADGTGKRWALTAASGFEISDPSWSPDGSRLVAVAWVGNLGRLALINPAAGTMSYVSVLLGGPVGYFPAFAPTGKTIVYTSPDAVAMDTIHTDGSGHQTIAAGPAGSTIRPVFSPDGKRIAFSRNVGGNFDVYVKNLVTGMVKRLTTNAASDVDPTWSGDGSRIAFTSNRSGKTQIWTVSSTGGPQVRITHTNVAEATPAWSH